ncbi:MAG: DUF1552 domain-containing protein [Myxococcaceae bacterium]|nr:DUF1552 domain-containing protein [Myxococcaceae bacterium]
MKLSRRHLLRGFGTVVALPFLESLEARGQTSAPKQRFVGYMTPNGVNMQRWNQDTSPTFTQLSQSQTLAPFLPALGSHFTMVNGLSCKHRPPMGPGGHHRGVTGFLTAATAIEGQLKVCIDPPATGYEGCAPAGASLDQVLAQALPRSTRYKSLELGPANNSINGGNCGGFPCPYLDNISWVDGSTPAAREISPARAFDRLFAGLDAGQSAAARAKRLARRTRVLDAVKADADALKPKLGRDDRARVDQYFTAIAQLEDDLRNAPPPQACTVGARPNDVGLNVDDPTDYIRTFHRILLLALQCDVSRVVTFMVGGGGNAGSYKYPRALNGNGPRPDGSWAFSNGVASGCELVKHHELSHWRNAEGFTAMPPTPEELTAMKYLATGLIDRYYLSELSTLLNDMKNTVDGPNGETLLDNTLVYYSSELSDSDTHSTDNLPILLVGGAGGALTGGRVINRPSGRVADLHIAIAQAFGVALNRFGNDGVQALPGVFTP